MLLVFLFLAAIVLFNGCAIFEPEPELDIVDTAIQNGNFTTLVSALTEAELVATLKGQVHLPYLPLPMMLLAKLIQPF